MKTLFKETVFYALFILMFVLTAIFKALYVIFKKLYNLYDFLSKKECCFKKKDLAMQSLS
jgi:hypothetical protein